MISSALSDVYKRQVYIKEKLIKLLDGHKDADLFITQGYICRNAYGEIDNLQDVYKRQA